VLPQDVGVSWFNKSEVDRRCFRSIPYRTKTFGEAFICVGPAGNEGKDEVERIEIGLFLL
jgi:hypothetical protein